MAVRANGKCRGNIAPCQLFDNRKIHAGFRRATREPATEDVVDRCLITAFSDPFQLHFRHTVDQRAGNKPGIGPRAQQAGPLRANNLHDDRGADESVRSTTWRGIGQAAIGSLLKDRG